MCPDLQKRCIQPRELLDTDMHPDPSSKSCLPSLRRRSSRNSVRNIWCLTSSSESKQAQFSRPGAPFATMHARICVISKRTFFHIPGRRGVSRLGCVVSCFLSLLPEAISLLIWSQGVSKLAEPILFSEGSKTSKSCGASHLLNPDERRRIENCSPCHDCVKVDQLALGDSDRYWDE